MINSEHRGNNCRGDEGSEIVSHVLVQFLVIVVFLALLQSALIIHTRNTAISAAGEGARRFALLGGTSQDAREQVEDAVASLWGEENIHELTLTREPRGGGTYEVAVVTLRTTFPIFLTFGPSLLNVRGTAIVEESLP